MPSQPPRHTPPRESTRPGAGRESRRLPPPAAAAAAADHPAAGGSAKEHAEARGKVISALALGVTQRIVALVVTGAVLLVSFVSSVSVYFGQQRDIVAARAAIAARQAQIDSLQDELNRWQDPAYVQAQARERLGWVMPGEVGYRVIDADGNVIGGTVLSEPPSLEPPAGAWYETLWQGLRTADKPVPTTPAQPSAPATIGPDTPESPR